jgi:pantetheine-phosphate adenylyltransferase
MTEPSIHKAICPGTFDPITLGHVDMVERAIKVFDRVILAVSQGPGKKTLLNLEERMALIEETFRNRKESEVISFDGLLVDLAKKLGVNTILRGLRTVSDFEYENQMSDANRFMNQSMETIFMMTDRSCSHLSSSLIREIVTLGGSVNGMVPPAVERFLKEKKFL